MVLSTFYSEAQNTRGSTLSTRSESETGSESDADEQTDQTDEQTDRIEYPNDGHGIFVA